jgi:Tol biopolymer transport system component
LTTEGAPFLIAAGGWSPTVASNGTLAFVQSSTVPSQLVWVDRKGSVEPLGALQGPLGQGSGPVMALSPDGGRLAHSIDSATGTEVWSYDLSRGVVTRLTVGATRVTSPIWTPDGREVVFGAFGRGRFWNVYSVPSTDTREPVRVLPTSTAYQWPCTISPDGRWLIYAERTGRGTDLWLVPRHQAGAAHPLLNTPFNEDYAKLSPDGQSLLYVSDESGQPEVYVRTFPIGSDRVQVSTNGGSMPIWAPDGREIFYRTPTALMAVTVTRTGRGDLAASTPQRLFSVDPEFRLSEQFVVAPNGRFLFARSTGRDHVSVILNWFHGVTPREGTP